MATTPETQFTHTIKVTWTGSNGTNLAGTMSDVGNEEVSFVMPILAGASGVFVPFSSTLAGLRQIMITAQGGDLALLTNDATLPTDTLMLRNGAATLYSQSGSPANPFTQDVTAFYVSNGGTQTAVLQIRALIQNA
jgi:hypothetical protein